MHFRLFLPEMSIFKTEYNCFFITHTIKNYGNLFYLQISHFLIIWFKNCQQFMLSTNFTFFNYVIYDLFLLMQLGLRSYFVVYYHK